MMALSIVGIRFGESKRGHVPSVDRVSCYSGVVQDESKTKKMMAISSDKSGIQG
jgi:hypothetical protein